MKSFNHRLLVLLFLASSTSNWAQTTATQSEKAIEDDKKNLKVVVLTGTRFTYPLVQKWIDDYNKVNPEVQLVIESRGTNDPTRYDILIEAYEPDEDAKKNRDYLYVARYAVLPVANSHSAFSKIYSDKGLNRDLIKQLFFHDITADKKDIKTPFTVYTRLQKAGAPITFTKYFGYEQKDILGKVIAGSDEHLLKALLRDSIGLSYLPLNLIYDQSTGKPHAGITVLPVDLDGNGKVSNDEKFYGDVTTVVQRLEEKNQKEISNLPIEYVNLSVSKTDPNPEAVSFLQWIIQNGQKDIHEFGFLKPEQSRLGKRDQFASQRGK